MDGRHWYSRCEYRPFIGISFLFVSLQGNYASSSTANDKNQQRLLDRTCIMLENNRVSVLLVPLREE